MGGGAQVGAGSGTGFVAGLGDELVKAGNIVLDEAGDELVFGFEMVKQAALAHAGLLGHGGNGEAIAAITDKDAAGGIENAGAGIGWGVGFLTHTPTIPDGRYSSGMCIRKALLVGTDLGLLGYWTFSLIGVITVGAHDATLHTWNWSFVPLDLVAIILGLAWSFTPQRHQLSQPLQITALAFTHAAGLMAISFFAQQPAEWGLSWWLVNLWLMLLPIGLATHQFLCLRPAVVQK